MEEEIAFEGIDIASDEQYISVYMRFKNKLVTNGNTYGSIIFINNKGQLPQSYNRNLVNYWNDNIGNILRENLEDNVGLLTMFIDNNGVNVNSPIRLIDIYNVDLRNKVIEECRNAIIEYKFFR